MTAEHLLCALECQSLPLDGDDSWSCVVDGYIYALDDVEIDDHARGKSRYLRVPSTDLSPLNLLASTFLHAAYVEDDFL